MVDFDETMVLARERVESRVFGNVQLLELWFRQNVWKCGV